MKNSKNDAMDPFQGVQLNAPTRNTFSLNKSNTFTADFGILYPCLLKDTVPGDTFINTTGITARTLPLSSPAFAYVDVKVRYFFVPYRLLYKDWKKFITGGDKGDFVGSPAYSNYKDMDANEPIVDTSLGDYLNLPTHATSVTVKEETTPISLLPFLAYQMIWSEYFRDENLEDEFDIESMDAFNNGGLITNSADFEDANGNNIMHLRRVSYHKDYFTSALPSVQKGPSVKFGSDTLPVYFHNDDDSPVTTGALSVIQNSPAEQDEYSFNAGGTQPGKLFANFQASSATTINALRLAFAIQRFYERQNLAGSRYVETILSSFGVVVPDATVQRPVYIGGASVPVTIGDIPNTTSTNAGALVGKGYALGTDQGFKFHCNEHGVIMGLAYIVPKPQYWQGLKRQWTRIDKLDFYWPDFAHLGEQDLKAQELYFNVAATDDTSDVFGYQSRYAEYKTDFDEIHGEFRHGNLKYWIGPRTFAAGSRSLSADMINVGGTYDETFQSIWSYFPIHDPNKGNHFLLHLDFMMMAVRPLPFFSTPV